MAHTGSMPTRSTKAVTESPSINAKSNYKSYDTFGSSELSPCDSEDDLVNTLPLPVVTRVTNIHFAVIYYVVIAGKLPLIVDS